MLHLQKSPSLVNISHRSSVLVLAAQVFAREPSVLPFKQMKELKLDQLAFEENFS